MHCTDPALDFGGIMCFCLFCWLAAQCIRLTFKYFVEKSLVERDCRNVMFCSGIFVDYAAKIYVFCRRILKMKAIC